MNMTLIDNNWKCSRCSNKNPPTAFRCLKCGKSREMEVITPTGEKKGTAPFHPLYMGIDPATFEKEYMNDPQAISVKDISKNYEGYIPKPLDKTKRKPKGRYLHIYVCPHEPIPPKRQWIEKEINTLIEAQIRHIMKQAAEMDVFMRFYWEDQYTVLSPCAPDLHWDDREAMMAQEHAEDQMIDFMKDNIPKITEELNKRTPPSIRLHGVAKDIEERKDGVKVVKELEFTHATLEPPKGQFTLTMGAPHDPDDVVKIRKRTTEEKVDYIIQQFALLKTQVDRGIVINKKELLKELEREFPAEGCECHPEVSKFMQDLREEEE